MKTFTSIRKFSKVFALGCLLITGLNSCNNIVEPVQPFNKQRGARGATITSGSGTSNDPYVMSDIAAIADGSGYHTDLDNGLYEYTGGYSSGDYYDPGYYLDPNYSTAPKPRYPAVVENATFSSAVNACTTFRDMWNRQNNVRHVEQAAFITLSGGSKDVVWLSDANNSVMGATLGGAINFDGRPGSKSFMRFGIKYTIKAIVHTHPIGGPPAYEDGVSYEDRQRAREFGVPIYSIADEGIGKGLANANDAGIIESDYVRIFNCALDQTIVPELN